jgi:uncharacterized protein YbjQ (UPF0145 family)
MSDKDTPETAAELQADEEAQRSLEAIEAGGIPLNAERRLKELRSGVTSFTSDLSVNGFALLHELGLEPLSQVMGSSIYEVGYQNVGWASMMGSSITEMRVLSDAWNEVRRRAFNRLELEARHAGADAVVGVQIRTAAHDWAAGSIEYMVLGTAVRRRGAKPAEQPILTELSVADYAKLLQAGVKPAGIVACTSVFYATFAGNWMGQGGMLGGSMGGALGGGIGGAYNFELREFTQAFYEARETVMERLGHQAQQLSASGIVGVRISHNAQRQDSGGMNASPGLIATFDAIGTAITETGDARPHAPKQTIDLSI